jgi:hypothetical protein
MSITTASQSQIGQDTAKNSQVVTTAVKIINSGGGGSSGPTISSIIVTDSGYNNLDFTTVETSNSFIKIIGTGFSSGANVFIGDTQIPAANVTFTSSTELRVRLPVLINNTNNRISIFNTNSTSGAVAANSLLSFTFQIYYLVVAGGGSGGSAGDGQDNRGGGGGAGGVLTGTLSSLDRGTYTITIGSGGAYGSSGANTTLGNLFTARGGGRGGISNEAGQPGGSGGGGGAFRNPGNFSGGLGTAGQGNNGGSGGTDSATYRNGGAGGGAGAVGGNGRAGTADGGVGIQSSISGTATYYGGGGSGSGGTGGLGGGGSTPGAVYTVGTAGATNTGGGGGGASAFTTTSGAGGSGILIISYPGAQRMTGGNVTTSGANTIHTFTSSGTLTY